MQYQAHRGFSIQCPENTMPAFRKAWELGYQLIEVDPRFTLDGECVAFHDKTINRTCRTDSGAEIPEPTEIEAVTYAYLQALDAGVFKGQEFKGTKVPKMSEVLAFAAEKELIAKMDNKFSSFTPEQQEKLFEIAQQSGATVAFTCKNVQVVEQIAQRFPDAPIHYDGIVTREHLEQIKGLLKRNPLTVWLALDTPLTQWVKIPKASEELCQMVKQYGQLGLWLLNRPEELEAAVALGADVIETNGGLQPAGNNALHKQQ